MFVKCTMKLLFHSDYHYLLDSTGHGETLTRRQLNSIMLRIHARPFLLGMSKIFGVGSPGHVRLVSTAISMQALRWALLGFPNMQYDMFKVCQYALAMTIEWLLPHSQTSRHYASMWNLATILSSVCALHHLWFMSPKMNCLRVVLRGCSRDLQRCILEKSNQDPAWRQYLLQLFQSVWCPLIGEYESVLYFAFAKFQKGWYVGKTSRTRLGNGGAKNSGPMMRFLDHIIMTYVRFDSVRSEQRYKSWRNALPCQIFFLPTIFDSESHITHLERFIIRYLEAPMQDRVRKSSFRPVKYRDWPAYRALRSIPVELQLNVHCKHPHPRITPKTLVPRRCPDAIQDFDHLLAWAFLKHNLSRDDVMVLMYHVYFSYWLCLFLAQPRVRIDYQRVWNSGHARYLMVSVWTASLSLPRNEASRVQWKTENFLKTTNLTLSHVHVAKLPINDPAAFHKAKRVFSRLLHVIRVKCSPAFASYLHAKLSVVKTRGPTLDALLPSHITFARQADMDHVKSLTQQDWELIRRREDVTPSEVNWDVPYHQGNEEIYNVVVEEFVRWCRTFHLRMSHTHVRRFIGDCNFTSRSADYDDLLQQIPTQCKVSGSSSFDSSMVAVVADKDAKRRIFMSRSGFLARMYLCFMEDPKFYNPRSDLTLKDAANYKNFLLNLFIPKKWRANSPFAEHNLQYVYQNYKAKCIDALTGMLICQRAHAHERDITSDFASPLKKKMKVIARAIRLCRQMCGIHSWTLWKMCDVQIELRKRVGKLVSFNDFSTTCYGCGGPKSEGVNCCKLDAAQFFKQANLYRGVVGIGSMLDYIQDKHKATAVAMRTGSILQGFFCKASRQPSQSFRIIPFSVIKAFLAFTFHDKYFNAASKVIERVEGWPAGGSLSEPGTLVDLNASVGLLDVDDTERKRVGWFIPELSFQQTVGGMLHVDDSIVFSKIFCNDCLERGVQRMWPPDVGVEREGTHPVIRFLHAVLVFDNCDVHVFPFTPNSMFSLGFHYKQKIARLGPYRGAQIHDYKKFQMFVWGFVLQADKLIDDDTIPSFGILLLFLRELALLQWPDILIARSLRSLPMRHSSHWARAVRRIGKYLYYVCVRFDGHIILDFCTIEFFTSLCATSRPLRDFIIDTLQQDSVSVKPSSTLPPPSTSYPPQLAGAMVWNYGGRGGGRGRGRGRGQQFYNNPVQQPFVYAQQPMIQQPVYQQPVYQQPIMQQQVGQQPMVQYPTVVTQPPASIPSTTVPATSGQTTSLNPMAALIRRFLPTTASVAQGFQNIVQAQPTVSVLADGTAVVNVVVTERSAD